MTENGNGLTSDGKTTNAREKVGERLATPPVTRKPNTSRYGSIKDIDNVEIVRKKAIAECLAADGE